MFSSVILSAFTLLFILILKKLSFLHLGKCNGGLVKGTECLSRVHAF